MYNQLCFFREACFFRSFRAAARIKMLQQGKGDQLGIGLPCILAEIVSTTSQI